MDKYENGQDTKCIIGGREYGVENMEDNAGETTLSEADSNMRMEAYTAPASVEHSYTISVDGSAREINQYLYDNNFHPKRNRRVHVVGSEYGSRGRQGTATSRAKDIPSKDGTSAQFEIRFDQAART